MMMSDGEQTVKIVHFEVHLSEPYETEIAYGEHKGDKHIAQRNVHLDVITTTAGRAIDLALTWHPGGTVHVVQKRGLGHLVFDPELFEVVQEGQ